MEFQALSLFNTEQSRIEVKKHSSLIQMTNQITLTQRKSVSVCICVAKEILKAQPDARVFTIDIGKFKRLAGIRSNNNAEVKQALRGLVSAKIEYNIFGKDKQSVRGAFNFLSHVKIIEEGAGRPSYVQFEFPSNVLEAVRHPSMYARLDMLILRWLNSKYAVAIYELMKDYAGIWTYSMSIEQFRHRMGLEAGEYTVVTMLRKRIIDKAVDEINNKTDIRVEYDLIKTGKSFSHIHFKVRPRQEIIQQEDETLQMLAQRGIKPAQASELFQKHDKQYILSHIAITEERIKRGKVQNPAAYFLKGLQLDYRETETEFTTVQKQKKAAREQEKVKAEESAAREKEQRSSEAIQKESAVASYLSGLSSEEVQKLQNLCYTEVIAPNALFNKAFGQRGFEHVAVQKVFSDFVFGYMNQ